MNIENQRNFASTLYETLFGLILFFNIQDLLIIKEPLHFIFYIFTLFVIIHWWLIFESAGDAFTNEVHNSVTDIILGVGYLILLELSILYSEVFDYWHSIFFLVIMITLDIVWALAWRYLGQWRMTKNKEKIKSMERELNCTLHTDAFIVIALILLLIFSSTIGPVGFVVGTIGSYFVFIWLTFSHKIIDLRFF